MRVSDWHVLPTASGKHYFCGYENAEELMKENGLTTDDLKHLLPIEKWSAEDFIHILIEFYEDNNRHSSAQTVLLMDKTCREIEMTDEQRTRFWHRFCERIMID